jgi:hypothetical protein
MGPLSKAELQRNSRNIPEERLPFRLEHFREQWLRRIFATAPMPAFKIVAVAIGWHMNGKRRGLAWPSMNLLASEAGVSRDQVKRTIKWLEANSYLRVTRKYIARLKSAPNHYFPLLPAKEDRCTKVFYQLVTRNAVDKTEAEYHRTVIRLLSEMRLQGRIPWSHIVDESRRTRTTQTFINVADALRDTAKYYRRSALRECGAYLEIWSEKEALSGIIWDVASDYDVPVVVSKGMPSLTQVYETFPQHEACSQRRQVDLYLSVWRPRSYRLSDPKIY